MVERQKMMRYSSSKELELADYQSSSKQTKNKQTKQPTIYWSVFQNKNKFKCTESL